MYSDIRAEALCDWGSCCTYNSPSSSRMVAIAMLLVMVSVCCENCVKYLVLFVEIIVDAHEIATGHGSVRDIDGCIVQHCIVLMVCGMYR